MPVRSTTSIARSGVQAVVLRSSNECGAKNALAGADANEAMARMAGKNPSSSISAPSSSSLRARRRASPASADDSLSSRFNARCPRSRVRCSASAGVLEHTIHGAPKRVDEYAPGEAPTCSTVKRTVEPLLYLGTFRARCDDDRNDAQHSVECTKWRALAEHLEVLVDHGRATSRIGRSSRRCT